MNHFIIAITSTVILGIGSGALLFTCDKEVLEMLIFTEPYKGEDHSIVLNPRTSTIDLYNIISRVELKNKNEAMSF